MYLVVGITGRAGGAVARQLLAQGKQVRALVRDRIKAADWATRGVELVEGDLHDADALGRALQGADGAFLMLPGVPLSRDYDASKKLVAGCLRALESAALDKLVVLSSIGAEQSSGVGPVTTLAMLEKALRRLAYPVAFIRPGMFFENFLYGLQEGVDGTLTVLFEKTDDAFPTAATEDIGAQAARLLTGPTWSGQRIIELGSPLTIDELASQIGAVIGREVKAQSLPRHAWKSALVEMGVPDDQTWAIEEMYEALNTHVVDFGAPGVEHIASNTSAREVFAAAYRAMQREG